jgi:hypothetical protein
MAEPPQALPGSRERGRYTSTTSTTVAYGSWRPGPTALGRLDVEHVRGLRLDVEHVRGLMDEWVEAMEAEEFAPKTINTWDSRGVPERGRRGWPDRGQPRAAGARPATRAHRARVPAGDQHLPSRLLPGCPARLISGPVARTEPSRRRSVRRCRGRAACLGAGASIRAGRSR